MVESLVWPHFPSSVPPPGAAVSSRRDSGLDRPTEFTFAIIGFKHELGRESSGGNI